MFLCTLRLFIFIALSTLLVVNMENFHACIQSNYSGMVHARRSLTEEHSFSLRKRSNITLRFSRPSSTRVTNASMSLDFVIAGFPKCGTTTLVYAFRDHEETDVGSKEKCAFTSPQISDSRAVQRMYMESLLELNQSPDMKRGMKCPTGIKNADSIERLHMHSPQAKVIIGVRHPVFFLQSYYNYRITEHYTKNWKEAIPSIDSLVGLTDWRGVSTDSARFELFLMQLGKTNMSTTDLSQLVGRPHMGVQPNNFKIFLYTLEQMDDPDENRAGGFRNELSTFLGLKQPLKPMGHENINHFIDQAAYGETINICSPNFKPLRDLLITQGLQSSNWIREAFLLSEDVAVANRDHFNLLLQNWGSDPCAESDDTATQ